MVKANAGGSAGTGTNTCTLQAGLYSSKKHPRHHPTEWKDKADSAKWSKLDKLLKPSPKMLKHEKERIDKYVFWDELSGKAKMTSSLIWHFHPVEFISTFSAKKVCACNAIVKATRWVSSSKTHYGPLHTGDKELGSAPQWDDLVSEG
ncbi:Uncharacterized protein ALO36_04901, partial [Pseudomonas syringae pv. tomato]